MEKGKNFAQIFGGLVIMEEVRIATAAADNERLWHVRAVRLAGGIHDCDD